MATPKKFIFIIIQCMGDEKGTTTINFEIEKIHFWIKIC